MIDFTFEDYLEKIKNPEKSEWLPVAGFCDFGQKSHLTIFSALFENNQKSRKRILNNYDWDLDFTGCWHPSFVTYSNQGKQKIVFESREFEEKGGVRFYPLVIYRNFWGAYPSQWEVIQNFILYNNIRWDEKGKKYIFLNLDEDEEEDIIRIEDNQVYIKTVYLRDYLAARKLVLVRFHDFTRGDFSIESSSDKREEKLVNNASSIFHLLILLRGKTPYASMLTGKDIILSFQRPASSKPKNQFEKFIIDKNERGKKIIATCGESHYMTPVFFEEKVLSDYYAEPSKYEVGPDFIHRKGLWHLPFAKNKEGKIYVWLYKLGQIPRKEQKHWARYNIAPIGGLNQVDIRRSIFAEFADPDDPVYLFKNRLEEINLITNNKLNFPLFLPLEGEDRKNFQIFHIPLTDDVPEFDQQINLLVKILNDSINPEGLKKFLKAKRNLGKKLNLLERFIAKVGGKNTRHQIVEPLRNLQNIRSSGADHRRGNRYDQVIKKLGLRNKSYKEIFEEIFNQVKFSLDEIANLLKSYKV